MTLIKYDRPDTNFIGKQFSDIMDEFFNDAVANRQSTFVPNINISETDNQMNIEVELPGINKDDIDLHFENGTLTISGERSFEDQENGRRYHRVETHYGSFSRSFQIPDSVDEESIEATYKDGILHVEMNKKEEKLKKQIDIK